MDLVRVSTATIGQLAQNSPKVNRHGAKLKITSGCYVCEFLDEEALFTGLFHVHAATRKASN
jgi:hypothetical protein